MPTKQSKDTVHQSEYMSGHGIMSSGQSPSKTEELLMILPD